MAKMTDKKPGKAKAKAEGQDDDQGQGEGPPRSPSRPST